MFSKLSDKFFHQKQFVKNFPSDFWEKKASILMNNMKIEQKNEILVYELFMNRVHSMETLFRILIVMKAFPMHLEETLSILKFRKFNYELRLWNEQKTVTYFEKEIFRSFFYPPAQEGLNEQYITDSLEFISTSLDLLIDEYQEHHMYNVLKHGFYATIAKDVSLSMIDPKTKKSQTVSRSPFMLNYAEFEFNKEKSTVLLKRSSVAVSYEREFEITMLISTFIKMFFSHQKDKIEKPSDTILKLFEKTEIEKTKKILSISHYSNLHKVSSNEQVRMSEKYLEWMKKHD